MQFWKKGRKEDNINKYNVVGRCRKPVLVASAVPGSHDRGLGSTPLGFPAFG